MYLTKLPSFIRSLYPTYLWREETDEKVIYLTFDDGPTPKVSAWVLEQLAQYEALATFFVLGKNVVAYPQIVHQIIDAGHSLGNHSHTHLNGWKVSLYAYLRDFLRAQRAITEYTGYRTALFRPPYARITPRQAKRIERTHQVVMMDVMSGDFDSKLSPDTIFKNVVENTKPGSIVCLHDSEKAWPRLFEALPKMLAHYKAEGYRFAALNPLPLQSEASH